MKTLIAASIIALSSSAAMAESFVFERQFGTPALFPTLLVEPGVFKNAGHRGSTSFAYERASGTPELFPSLIAEVEEKKAFIGESVVGKDRDHDSIWGWDVQVGG